MKFLVLASCMAVATAQLVAHPNGAVVPADEPSVAAARAAHLSAHGVAHPYAAYPYGAYPYAAGYGAGYAAYPYAGYAYPYGAALVAHPNGAVVPVDEPSVQAAKAEHFAAKGLPVAPVAAAGYYAHPAVVAHPGLVAHPNGAVVPVEPADVVAARADHLAAHLA